MNIRKAFLLTLIIAIAFIGLTLTGCEKKSDEPAVPTMDTEAAEDMLQDADKAIDETVDSAEKALEETKAAAEKPAADHPGH